MAFFMWNAIIVGAEQVVGKWWVFQRAGKILPQPLVTFLVLMTALPVTHWFTGDYVKSDYFE
eukprot:CAMPEP_0172485318 /NCGR_PEP_ID=MMETSP1066-20121228/13326_1 /TAXON_ID=671091 /ORGANISM="Coscinodiscus wailesii, Strain CCMP2513" /LENGTH=61 /DNA_ID=CAMNT_0013250521 /DNA_START=1143 /DNA_END=1325 /DNA_ORIENTATION=+